MAKKKNGAGCVFGKRNFGVKWLRVLKQLQFIILLRAPLIVGVGAPCCGYILPQTQVI